jgi:hypothetical protein
MKKDLFVLSEYTKIISSILKHEFHVPVVISQLHEIKFGDGITLFYAITREGHRFLVNIMGRKVQDDAILYWIENIDHSGKVCEFYYDQDRFVMTFSRGEKFNHEFLAYIYLYGNRYPAIFFVPGKIYRSYSLMLARIYNKHVFYIPDELCVSLAKAL